MLAAAIAMGTVMAVACGSMGSMSTVDALTLVVVKADTKVSPPGPIVGPLFSEISLLTIGANGTSVAPRPSGVSCGWTLILTSTSLNTSSLQ